MGRASKLVFNLNVAIPLPYIVNRALTEIT